MTSGSHGQDSNKEGGSEFGPVDSVLLGSLNTCSLISAKMGDFRKSSAREVTKA